MTGADHQSGTEKDAIEQTEMKPGIIHKKRNSLP